MSDVSPEELLDFLVDLFVGEPLLPQIPFEVLFPDQTEWPQYFLTLPEGLPPKMAEKTFKIFDLYCPVSSCECHKVSLAFVDPEGEAWATVSYGWRSTKFYRQWGLDLAGTKALKKGFLDPSAEQSDRGIYFLTYFQEVLKKDPLFISHIKERYAYVKNNLTADFFEDSHASSQVSALDNVVPLKPVSSSR